MLKRILETFSGDTAGVLAASLLGNRNYLSQDTAERFRAGGTFHILVISGLHISFIGFLSLLLTQRLTRNRFAQFAVSVATVWAYSFMVGAEASVVRAALMFTAVSFAPVINRQKASFNALGGAALILLVYRPSDLFDPSFQLTFLSVFAIVALAWPALEKFRSIGKWQPSEETPYPPNCVAWFRKFAEMLYWSERAWTSEMKRTTWRCKLFKTPMAERLERLRVQPILRFSVEALVVSLSVTILMLPLMVILFHRLSISAFVLNILVEILMAAACLSALVALLVSTFSETLSLVFINLAEISTHLAIHSVDPFARLNIASFRLPEYSGWSGAVYALYYLPMTALLIALARWQPLGLPKNKTEQIDNDSFVNSFLPRPSVSSLALLALVLIIVLHPFSAHSTTGRLRVDFLDVGQGDAALVTMPDGTRILIDGGGRHQNNARSGPTDEGDEEPFMRDTRGVGESVVSEFLWHQGVSSVDYLIATHADLDHIDGLNDVARNFKVKAALVGRAPSKDSEFARFTETLKERNVPIQIISRGDVFEFGGATIEILWPNRSEDKNAPSKNSDSVTLILRYGSRAFLFTGDIESNTENALLISPELLRCDVVKVPHHGSRTSSTENFIKATQARIAIISVGLLSPFGHPHKEVVQRWRAHKAEVITTGEKGTITVSADGKDLKVETFVR
jgi:competence protein ComEC